MNRSLLRLLAVLVVPLAVLAACGDDEDDVAAYCELVEELDAQEDFPSDEQLDELREVAPDEIEEEIGLVVDRIQEDGEQAFDDPEVTDAIEEIEAYEVDACDREDVDPAGDDADDTTTTTERDTTTTSELDTTTTSDDTTTTSEADDTTTTTSG